MSEICGRFAACSRGKTRPPRARPVRRKCTPDAHGGSCGETMHCYRTASADQRRQVPSSAESVAPYWKHAIRIKSKSTKQCFLLCLQLLCLVKLYCLESSTVDNCGNKQTTKYELGGFIRFKCLKQHSVSKSKTTVPFTSGQKVVTAYKCSFNLLLRFF